MPYHDDDFIDPDEFDDDFDDSESDEFSDEFESDEYEIDARYDTKNSENVPLENIFPPRNWQEAALIGAISEEIADERNRRYRESREEHTQQKKLEREKPGHDTPLSQHNRNNIQNNQISGKLLSNTQPKSSEQIHKKNFNSQNKPQANKPREVSNLEGILNVAFLVFIVFLISRAC